MGVKTYRGRNREGNNDCVSHRHRNFSGNITTVIIYCPCVFCASSLKDVTMIQLMKLLIFAI